jgi:hypothetical protein
MTKVTDVIRVSAAECKATCSAVRQVTCPMFYRVALPVSTSASYPPSTNCPLKAKGSNMGILGEEPCFAMRSFVTSHLTILTLARARDSL